MMAGDECSLIALLEPDELISRWESLDVEQVALAEISENEPYQPRDNEDITKAAERHRRIADRRDLIEEMVTHLRRSKGQQLTPVWLIPSGNSYFIVDGHHRRAAYAQAGRTHIQAKVYRGPDAEAIAHQAALVVNQTRKVPLHAEEAAEQAWRVIGEMTRWGDLSWEQTTAKQAGMSHEKLAKNLGGRPGSSTIGTMLQKAVMVREKFGRWTNEDSWPKWRDAKRPTFFKRPSERTPEQEWAIKRQRRIRMENQAAETVEQVARYDDELFEEFIRKVRRGWRALNKEADDFEERTDRHREDIRCNS